MIGTGASYANIILGAAPGAPPNSAGRSSVRARAFRLRSFPWFKARDIEDIVGLCESEAAIGLVQERNRELLKALSRERQDLYRHFGQSFVARLETLQQRPSVNSAKRRQPANKGAEPGAPAEREKEDARAEVPFAPSFRASQDEATQLRCPSGMGQASSLLRAGLQATSDRLRECANRH